MLSTLQKPSFTVICPCWGYKYSPSLLPSPWKGLQALKTLGRCLGSVSLVGGYLVGGYLAPNLKTQSGCKWQFSGGERKNGWITEWGIESDEAENRAGQVALKVKTDLPLVAIPYHLFEPPQAFLSMQHFLLLFHPKKPAIISVEPLN